MRHPDRGARSGTGGRPPPATRPEDRLLRFPDQARDGPSAGGSPPQNDRKKVIAATFTRSTKKAETSGRMMKAFGEGP